MTRRTWIQTATLGCNAIAMPGAPERPLILAYENHTLAVESARGFCSALGNRLLVDRSQSFTAPTILAALRARISRQGQELADRIRRGQWVLIESGLSFSTAHESIFHRDMMRDLFALELEPIVAYPQLDQHYVHYQWPVNRIFRHFSQITPVSAASNEIIARVGDIPVAVRKSIGRGGVVYIGTPLGPILTSHDREAQQLALALANNIIRSSIGFS